MNVNEKFIQKVKEERLKQGLSRADLAKKAGLAPQTVSAWERSLSEDKVRSITLETAVAVSDALGISLDQMCGSEAVHAAVCKPQTAYDVVIMLEALEEACHASVRKTEVPLPPEAVCRIPVSPTEWETVDNEYAIELILKSGDLVSFYDVKSTLKRLVEQGHMTEEMYQTCVQANLEKLKQVKIEQECDPDDDDEGLPF